MRRTICIRCVTRCRAACRGASAQASVPEIAFDAAPIALKLPADIHLGEAAGVATNSTGMSLSTPGPAIRPSALGNSRLFAHGGSRLFEFDRTGNFVREIGQGIYGFLVAHAVRVDPQDNIWVVDERSSHGDQVRSGRAAC